MKKTTPSLSLVEKTDLLSVNEWVYKTLRKSIMCGEIRPGSALTIRGLAECLEVSPMPVREALRKLVSEAAVEIKDNRRVTVPLISPEKFKSLFALRTLLETHAAETALPYFTTEKIAELEQLDVAVDEAYSCGDVVAGSLANQAFHRFIYVQDPNQLILPMIESVWLQLGPFVRIGLSQLEQYYKYDRHQEAIEALRQRDAFALRRAIESDIRDGLSMIRNVDQIYENLKAKSSPTSN
ncbi:MAG: GntR family transcriptional regulator [Proteobacteria bacterium]|nr:MAG: GntR family transcriptional regulator [Pseudomonadota bacterium]